MMKKTVMMGFGAIAIAALSSCSDEMGGYGSGKGCINPAVDVDTEAVTSRSSEPLSRAEYGDITKDMLSLRITKADGSYQKTWDKLADFASGQAFTVGDYTVEAFYGDAAVEGFEAPAFSGSTNISVADGRTTNVALTATLSKAMFSIEYTEAFKDFMQAYSAEYTTAAGNTFAVAADELRPVYVAPGDVTVKVKVTTPAGKEATFNVATVKAEAKYHYHIKADVNNGEVGGSVLTVTFDENLATEIVEISLDDKLLSSQAPEVTADGFDPANPVYFIAGFGSDAKPKMSLVAMAGLKSVALHTESASLLAQGWPADVELLGNEDSRLTALGLKAIGLWNKPDQMAIIDFSDVLAHIMADANNPVSTFTVTVTDKLNRVGEPMTLTVTSEAPNLMLSKLDDFEPGENLRVNLDFNGSAEQVREKVVFSYTNAASGTSRKLDIIDVQAAGRALNSYIVTITTPVIETALELSASCGGVTSKCIIDFANFEVLGNENDTYATHAYVTVAGTDGSTPDLSAAKFFVKGPDDSEFRQVASTDKGGYFDIDGLTPGAANKVKVTINGSSSRAITLNTEAAAQLPNSDMELWDREFPEGRKSDYWWIDYPGQDRNNTVWGTLNALTTSKGAKRTEFIGIANKESASYCAFSGTRPTGSGFEDRDVRNGSANKEIAHSGNYAAVISTVGWGDNSATSTSKSKEITAGELYLGSYNPDTKSANYSGYGFASRPKSLQFYYYYCVKNSADYGYVKIWLTDNAGNTIATAEKNLTASADYKPETVDLVYTDRPGKASKIYVVFKSSNNPDCLTTSNDNLSAPKATNLSNGRFTGSELFVDDLKLVY